MDFKEYQDRARETAIYPDKGNNFIYPTLGLVGEAGEVAEKIKKVLRDKEGVINEETKNEITKELGDILWYISQLAFELKISLDEVAEGNIRKLASRKERGVVQGEGDDR